MRTATWAAWCVAIVAAVVATTAHAQDASEAWADRTLSRWSAIQATVFHQARLGDLSYREPGEDDATWRGRITEARAAFDQSIAELRADIAGAGAAPDLSALFESEAAALIVATPATQTAMLDRLSAMAALEERNRLALVGGTIDAALEAKVRLHLESRELAAWHLEMTRLALADLPAESGQRLWVGLTLADAQAVLAAYEARSAILANDRSALTEAQTRANEAAASLTRLAPSFVVPHTGSRPAPEEVVPPDFGYAQNWEQAFDQAPAIISARAGAIRRDAASWSAMTPAQILAEAELTHESVIAQLIEIAEGPPPPPL
ncbi:MAG: hypothetical protein AB7O98_13920 [Hyphomonadaceae bacterium]